MMYEDHDESSSLAMMPFGMSTAGGKDSVDAPPNRTLSGIPPPERPPFMCAGGPNRVPRPILPAQTPNTNTSPCMHRGR
ncbi:hypothetical protein K466DRAFT_377675 [Polyporus arcularius HHB13444]|uniref:Uncharacterized protein n=1 Tax=Polyporus arcularius HHB13444 TaxID=1314778 RepID=A0A5C3PWW1_9APHY|nr:hypothetical protein K466DRAFT_377675 [Polyporus arcularius HHB13444]